MGTINRFGNFTPDWSKIRTFVYPIHGTKNSEVRTILHSPRRLRRARMMIEAQSRLMPPQLTPFVDASLEKVREIDAGKVENYEKRFTGEDYLRAWKMAGGHDIVETGSGAVDSGRNIPTPFEERPATKS